ncbi:MAG: pyruvate kinase [Rhodothermales bacterium]
MERRTKIVCTLGPASSSREVIRGLIEAGMDVARLNFSHGTHDDHRAVIRLIREESERAGRVVPILQDLQGPKIRLGAVEQGGVLIHKGHELTLTSVPLEVSNQERAFVSYDSLADDVHPGGRILIDDGLIELRVKSVNGTEVLTEVVVGGPLRSKKGVNLPHIRTSAPSMTEKDIEDLEFGLGNNVDFIALSFVRTSSDVDALIDRVRASGREVGIIAKIEKPEAVEHFDEILDRVDGIMIARGDLGIEMPMQEVPIVQKQIIRKCLDAAKPVITATQMLESMIDNPRPTRAEASDVANAVLDGSDCVMLSGETAAGKYPVRTVEAMNEIIRFAEDNRRMLGGWQAASEVHADEGRVTQAISYTAVQLASETGAVAIACLTHSGGTARAVARHRPKVPVFAFTDNQRIVGQMAMVWGTRGIGIPFQHHTDDGIGTVRRILTEQGIVKPGDSIIITAGLPLPSKGLTNMVHVSRL